MAALGVSTWGDPTATKRAFLIHGILGSSQNWHRIAQEFASRGYFVTAPDLLGHGNARRGSDYTITALAEELRPFLSDHPYDVVVGFSLGGVVASALLPLLASPHPVRVVLVDPPLEQTIESVRVHRKRVGDIARNSKTPAEAYHEERPQPVTEDSEEAVSLFASARACDTAAVEAILDQNLPWSFARLLSTVPDNVQVAILAADPSKEPCTRMEDLEPYPHVASKVVWGASHLLPYEFPLVVVETALEGTMHGMSCVGCQLPKST